MAGHVVVGAAVVLPTTDGSERYFYRGAAIGEGFTADGIKHALSVGLIEKVKAPSAAEKAAAEKAATEQAEAEKAAADAAAKAAAENSK